MTSRDRARAQSAALTRRTGASTASPDPSALVIFGVTGDLSRKKLMPAVYDLANRGLLPPGFGARRFRAPRLGRPGLRAGRARRRASSTRRTRFRRGRSGASWLQGSASCQGEFDDDAAFTRLNRDPGEARPRPRHDGQPRVLPVDPAEGVPARGASS